MQSNKKLLWKNIFSIFTNLLLLLLLLLILMLVTVEAVIIAIKMKLAKLDTEKQLALIIRGSYSKLSDSSDVKFSIFVTQPILNWQKNNSYYENS